MEPLEATPISVLRNRRTSVEATTVDELMNDGGREKKTVSMTESPQSTGRSSLSPVLSRRRLSGNTEDDASASPLQSELRKLNRMASTVAMAVTESHQSDEDRQTSEDEEEEIVTDLQDKDLFSESSGAKLSPAETLHRRLEQPTVIPQVEVSEKVPQSVIGMIDALDKRLSLPLFMLDFGKGFEYAMLVFGTWFGLPVPAWGLWTAFMGFLDEFDREIWKKDGSIVMPFRQATYWRRDVTASLIALAFVLYSISFVRWLRKGKYNSVYANLKQLIAIPMLYVVVFHYGSHTKGHNVGGFFTVAWVVAEVIGHLFKYCFHRVRPVAYLGSSLPKRHFPEVQAMFSKGHTAFESFPSADTTGGAVFSAVLLCMKWVSAPFAVGLSIVIAFSRIYLQAHHLLDVGFGLLLGWGTTLIMWPLFGEQRYFGRASAAFSMFFFIAFALAARKFKPALPKHMQRAKSMYGF